MYLTPLVGCYVFIPSTCCYGDLYGSSNWSYTIAVRLLMWTYLSSVNDCMYSVDVCCSGSEPLTPLETRRFKPRLSGAPILLFFLPRSDQSSTYFFPRFIHWCWILIWVWISHAAVRHVSKFTERRQYVHWLWAWHCLRGAHSIAYFKRHLTHRLTRWWTYIGRSNRWLKFELCRL